MILIFQVCEFGGDDCVKAPSVVDRTAYKYSDRLSARVEDIYNQLKVPCNLLDIPPQPTPPPPTKRKEVVINAPQKEEKVERVPVSGPLKRKYD